MVIRKTNPVGLDVVIDKIQTALENNLDWANLLTIYPRCYVNIREFEGNRERTIEHYENGQDYTNLIHAENNKCFFVETSNATPRDAVRFNTTLELFFTLELPVIKADVMHRADAEVHADVLNELKKLQEVTVNELVTGINDVYSGFPYRDTDDQQPYHCFKVQMEVYYDPLQKKSNC